MKKLSKVICIFMAAGMLVACGAKENTQINENVKETVQETTQEIVLTDQIGREVKLEKPAETVVSSYYIATTTLISLGAEDQLVGVEMKADSRAIYKLAAPQILELPEMGNKKNFNLEECAKMNPDLVILPISLKDYAAQLEELEIPALVVNPEKTDSFLECVTLLGQATGHEAEAEKLIAYYAETQQKIDEALSDVETKKTVYFGKSSDVLESATAKMFQYEVITAAKGEAVFADLDDKGWTPISAEQLLMYHPEYIFLENDGQADVNAILNDERFALVEAVANKNVYAFPSAIETWDTPGPASALGTFWMSSVLYPENISMETVEEEAVNFYQEFYDVEVSAEQLGI